MSDMSEEKFNAWLKSCPRAPARIKFAKSYFMNPLIGNDIYETALNIRYIIRMLKDAADSPQLDEGLNLSEDGTFGLSEILHCMIGALQFEDECRDYVCEDSAGE